MRAVWNLNAYAKNCAASRYRCYVVTRLETAARSFIARREGVSK